MTDEETGSTRRYAFDEQRESSSGAAAALIEHCYKIALFTMASITNPLGEDLPMTN